ncbi:MAG: DUF1697 domain-containing protein [Ilumatobacter sp.]
MTTHALFLRAINTGARRVTNEQLLEPLIGAGFSEVAAFQAAGNLIVNADGSESSCVDSTGLTTLLSNAYGFHTPVFARSVDQLRSVVERAPFTDAQIAATTGKIQVTFMSAAPSAQLIADVAAITPDEDLVCFDGSEWFWLPVDGVSGSRLPVKAIERIVGPMTMRTLGTVERLLKKCASNVL